LRRAAEMVRFGWRAYWRWRYRQTTLRLLRSMDEHLLGGFRGWSPFPAIISCQRRTAFDQRLRKLRIRTRPNHAIVICGWEGCPVGVGSRHSRVSKSHLREGCSAARFRSHGGLARQPAENWGRIWIEPRDPWGPRWHASSARA